MDKISNWKRRQLKALVETHGEKCVYCGRTCVISGDMTDPTHASREHLIPKARGGTEIALACIACNRVKSDMTAQEYRFFLATGRFADSYVEWITGRTRAMAKELGIT